MPDQNPSQRRCPPELRERAMRMMVDAIGVEDSSFGVITRIARQLGVGDHSLRNWVRQTEIDWHRHPGTTADAERIRPGEPGDSKWPQAVASTFLCGMRV
jgi:transposase